MRVIIDRFEGPYAVCEKEDMTMMDIKRINLPKNAKEGCVLDISSEGKITINIEETKKRKRKIDSLTKDIWN
ncbi:DUF3006 domain-containing protein [Clostridium luticellarii]|jgi:hypothetical protein|uniref:DUF3006 domain-containing protein n=1 Tax=Clostridium luticellarii TaxID=1691940 RepID=A0A2T0B344_9CLOT|nr:DUF3006 domain-containing protein [Clostridium luticellarii]MCI1944150.1 DUF3006 domain-containing protein [Clostridium luticellarii]MCI1967652.1 DUF3006 domain-containing protein [Clostridium luticellarii]MCI1996346.1 DUF3006 domain-containing protein [Clostridium luticellarii]MCI2039961.1 DUF3006 domain-containing protein [Clostridium luticellarii]PRR78177.1 hypothetical protein CLLU_36750 [Clostridium luticellarii]